MGDSHLDSQEAILRIRNEIQSIQNEIQAYQNINKEAQQLIEEESDKVIILNQKIIELKGINANESVFKKFSNMNHQFLIRLLKK